MKRKSNKWFWMALLIPLLVLLSMLIKPVSTKMYGQEAVLATVPIDPRDLLYGDYVIMDLEIEQIDPAVVDSTLLKDIEADKYYDAVTVYVSLRKGENGIFQAEAVSEQKPKGLFLKGRMYPYLEEEFGGSGKKYLNVEYGIERFYVEEGTGIELEELARKGKVLVSVKIHNGYPVVTGIEGFMTAD